jgi:sugar lactone lactonase YvrE
MRGAAGGSFFIPDGIGLSPSGNMYVVDRGNNRLDVFGPASTAGRAISWGKLKAAYR